MPLKLKKTVKQMLAEANAEVETISGADSIKLKDDPNADAIIGSIMLLLFLLLLFAPFIPVLKHLPKWIPIYRIIWRDWYAQKEGSAAKGKSGRR